MCAGSFTDICLGDCVPRLCVSLCGENAHTCEHRCGRSVFQGCVCMGVYAHLCVANVPACALWGFRARKSQRQQLAERVMTCL